MNQMQTVEPTVETPKAPAEAPAAVEVKEAAPATEVKQEATQRIEALREISVKVADTGLGWGRFALERSARALDRAAGQLGHWQEKLRTPEPAPEEQPSQAAA